MEEKTCFYCGSKATVEAYEVGKSVEQERIIKLLEAESPCQMKGMHHDIGFCPCQAIALIKGEK